MHTLDNLHEVTTGMGEVGATVRLGGKWAARLKVGDKFQLQETLDGTSMIVGAGQASRIWQGSFSDIPFWAFEEEHEETSYDGLLESMRKAYGEDFDEDSHVTALCYVRCEL
jgi:hypothetical protein